MSMAEHQNIPDRLSRTTRRRFLRTTASAGLGYFAYCGLGVRASDSPNERIRMASIGIGGRGGSNTNDAAQAGELVAVCDTDTGRLEGAAQRFPHAKRYTDFREMFDQMAEQIDAVVISTPDHTHAAPGLMAMRLGKHCFCEKPLARTVYEARLMGQVARQQGVATLMGNQHTAADGLRRAAAMLRAGVVGKVSEVHVWSNRPGRYWTQGNPRPAPQDVPAHLDWDLWLGPAPSRSYAAGYHPGGWRGWWDFGTGALGDMACHTMNMPFAGLDLRDPVSIQAESSGHNRDSFPLWSIITYEFPATESRGALRMIWYDGGKRCPAELLDGQEPSESGSLILGDRGKLYSPGDNGGVCHLMGGAPELEVEFRRSPGHFAEWIQAIRGGEPAMSNFPDYAAPLSETGLLGNLALWVADQAGVGPKIEWDAKNQKVTNLDGLETLVKPRYRDGYVLDV
jgi:predicted dehydrogenase